MSLGTPAEVKFGDLKNAPNGHITYIKLDGSYRVYVDGRTPEIHGHGAQGAFLFQVPRVDADALKGASYTRVFYAASPASGDEWDRNYGAFNGLVVEPMSGNVLAFCDGEYHPDYPVGNPFISSIGVATSTDGGMTWTKPIDAPQIIEGLDVAQNQLSVVAKFISGKRRMDSGASGPSAVVVGGAPPGKAPAFAYVFYADRDVMYRPQVPSGIHVARAQVADAQKMSAWQKWQGAGWGEIGSQMPSDPVVTPPAGAPEATQPNVSWNTFLKSWVMIFHTERGLYLTTSKDLLHWADSQLIVPREDKALAPAFGTFISPVTQASSAVTDGEGLLFYAIHDRTRSAYVGYWRTMKIGFQG